MSARCRTAFTLVELLVVIAIIGILTAITVPAIQQAREIARRANCVSNLRNCALGVEDYSLSKQNLPPSRQADLSLNVVLNWVVPVLPYIEERGLADQIRSGTLPTQSTGIEIMECPSAGYTEANFPLHYVVSGGRANSPTNLDWPANSVFLDRGVIPHPGPEQHTLANVSKYDGVSNTLLICENINAQSWLVAPEQQHSQALWFPEDPASVGFIGLNQDSGVSALDFDANIRYARPSSDHPGGFNVAMCDGSVRFMTDETDYRVYAVLMTPRGARADDPNNASFAGTDPPWQNPSNTNYPGTSF